ncbi:MAG TPA: hypothetical protein DDW52_24850 [Planctomycetaceae bacterium]|nr:hypothetical protein [Planctomycetaceae bacterium]
MPEIDMPLYNDTRVWSGFAYDLLYPGVLGSMIFDLLDPLRLASPLQLALLAIAVTFAVDYLHLRFNLGIPSAEGRETNSRPTIDIMIASLFCLGYFTIAATTNENVFTGEPTAGVESVFQLFGLGFTAFALGFAAYYNFVVEREYDWTDAAGKLIPALILAGTGICAALCGPLGGTSIAASTIVAAGIYAFYVLRWADQRTIAAKRFDAFLDKLLFIAFAVVVVCWVVLSGNWVNSL